MTTTTDRDQAHEAIGGTVRPHRTRPGHLVTILGKGRSLTVSLAEAEALAQELRQAVFDHAPELVRVAGYDAGDSEPRALPAAEVAVYQAEGRELVHGLRCPHCQNTAWEGWDDSGIYIVDVAERWSGATYLRADGKESVYTGGADSEFDGLGYRCGDCYQPVRLPAGVEEVWN